MKLIRNYWLPVLLSVMVLMACENVNEPYNIKGHELPAYVHFSASDSIQTANEGGSIDVQVSLPISIGQNVDFSYSLSGDAVPQTDWKISGVSGNKGSGVIKYKLNNTDVDDTTITIVFPKDGVKDGVKTLIITLTSAKAADGSSLGVGQGKYEKRMYINIQDFEDVPGTYDYSSNTSFGNPSGTIQITRNPVQVSGTTYEYQISDFAADAFSSPIPYPFNIDSNGNISAPKSYDAQGVAADITGTYSTTNGVKIHMDVTLQCCGAAGATWYLDMTKQ